MAAPKNPSNKIMKAKEAAQNVSHGELMPPSLASGTLAGPRKKLKTLGDIQDEQNRLYELVFTGTMGISDYTKLMYGLMQMTNTLKSKAEIDALEDAYIKQWQGVRIIAPAGEPVPDLMQQAIEGEILDGD
jgi:hypothetical protein